MKLLIIITAIILLMPELLCSQVVKAGTNEITVSDSPYVFSQSKAISTKPASVNDLSPRFKVASVDYNANGIVTAVNWKTAVTCACDSQVIDGETGWRLPTKHELMTIYLVNNQLKKPLEGSNAAIPSCFYWSSTQKSNAHAWFVTYLNGQSSAFSKLYFSRVRCIKDL